ncbi:MAG: Uma2 family endonuclease [Armatimonadaceae bacterium]
MSTEIRENVAWEEYEALLKEHDVEDSLRLTYDRGVLEILHPVGAHEEVNQRAAAIVESLLRGRGKTYENRGSLTFKRRESRRGVDPDTCFYIQNADAARGKTTAELETGNPPPDLVIEIDDPTPSLSKLPLFSEFEFPEVWRIVGREAFIMTLQANGQYVERDHSLAIANVTIEQLNDLLQESGA